MASSQYGGINESKVESSFLPPTSYTIILSGNRQYSAKNRDWYEAGQWVFRQYFMVEKRQPTRQEVKEALEQIGEVDDTKMDKLYKSITQVGLLMGRSLIVVLIEEHLLNLLWVSVK